MHVVRTKSQDVPPGEPGAVSYTHLDVYKRQVHEGDAAGDLGQSLGDGVLLAEDVDVAEVAEERVGEDIQQQAGGGSDDHLGQIAGGVLVQLTELEHLVSDRTAGDADDELQEEGGDGIADVYKRQCPKRSSSWPQASCMTLPS